MKKILLILAAAALIAVAVIFNSCEEDNPVSCTNLLNDITSASLDYISDPSANCNDYKDALKEYLDSDCDNLDDIYQSSYDNLTCN